MDATRLYLADCVGVIVLPISLIIIASAYKELIVLFVQKYAINLIFVGTIFNEKCGNLLISLN